MILIMAEEGSRWLVKSHKLFKTTKVVESHNHPYSKGTQHIKENYINMYKTVSQVTLLIFELNLNCSVPKITNIYPTKSVYETDNIQFWIMTEMEKKYYN